MMIYLPQSIVLLFFMKKIGRQATIDFDQVTDLVLFVCSIIMIVLINDNISSSQVPLAEANQEIF